MRTIHGLPLAAPAGPLHDCRGSVAVVSRCDWAQVGCTGVGGWVVRGARVGLRLRSGLVVAGLAGVFRVFRMGAAVGWRRRAGFKTSVGGCLGLLKD